MQEKMKTIREAATALCDQWDTPLWKDAKHTSVLVHELRTALAQPEQEPVAWMCCAFDGKVCEQSNHDECENPIPLYTAPPPKQEARNFCPRCGKRTPDLAAVHTCTPPRGLEMT